ncbi:zinc ABC transporter permease subunit ZnuB [Thalassolituus maritimus]|uniref:High-affinity zinc uptake system membrane protein ZnuB n=2 Tax=Thalassolituus maritimus TaxID=484498 RepID=A0ABQ0A2Y1_9GAMM
MIDGFDTWWLMPLAAGLLLAVSAGPLGSFVVWRRMAFFGDTLAHGALLGVTFGVLTDLNPTLALVLGSVALALVLLPLQLASRLSADTLLGIVSHGTLAIGLVALSLTDGVRVDLMGYLFGDLLAINEDHVLWLIASTVLTLTVLIVFWDSILAVTVSPELAKIEGRPVLLLDLVLIMLLALTVALAMKVVGILLISALLIMPPAAAHALSRGPRRMAAIASVIGIVSVAVGMWSSFHWDTPAGPSIVVTAMLLFVASLLVPRRN